MIGISDSGLGGLSALKEVRRLMPHEDIVYFGDTGRVPYGTRSLETIRKYARQDERFLLSHNVKMIVAACGNGQEFVTKLISEMDARVLAKGRIENYDLKMEGGLDVGRLDVAGENGRVSLTFFNEYMLAEQDGVRLATFPDLICTLDANTGEAISTAEATNGREAYALVIPKERLILGAGMRQRSLFREVEELIHKDMTVCNDGLFVD